MPGYIVYEKDTGRIVRYGKCSRFHIPLQATASQTAMEIQNMEFGMDSKYKIIEGELVPITA